MTASPSPEVGVTVPAGVSARDLLAIGKQTPRVYVPRIIHVDWATIHVLIGAASHTAWKILAKKYKMIRLKGKSAEHKKLTGDIMRKVCWELISERL
jgi:hypothetical protein